MKNLFELPELLTLDGQSVTGSDDLGWKTCNTGCNDGCSGGYTGNAPGSTGNCDTCTS